MVLISNRFQQSFHTCDTTATVMRTNLREPDTRVVPLVWGCPVAETVGEQEADASENSTEKQ
jgi:hypothetical protein